jgi:hypothetical protein
VLRTEDSKKDKSDACTMYDVRAYLFRSPEPQTELDLVSPKLLLWHVMVFFDHF